MASMYLFPPETLFLMLTQALRMMMSLQAVHCRWDDARHGMMLSACLRLWALLLPLPQHQCLQLQARLWGKQAWRQCYVIPAEPCWPVRNRSSESC
jgi:hypothetical protein